MTVTNSNIVPHLWYDKEAKEAAEFYTRIFPESKITNITTLRDTPSGESHSVSFKLWDQHFMAISAGPFFKFNPSISLRVNFNVSQKKDASEELNEVWSKLSEEGTVIMPLEKYPFSEKFGWIQDKFGLSWQLVLTHSKDEEKSTIMPSLMFVGDNCGRAEEAIHFYLSVFKNSKSGHITHIPKDSKPGKEGTIMFSDFVLENQWFNFTDNARDQNFNFNESTSFMVHCDTQVEIDYYWSQLSNVPDSEQCGWLKDKFGVSWQIVPREMGKMMNRNYSTLEQIERVSKAFFKMKKLDLSELRKAYKG